MASISEEGVEGVIDFSSGDIGHPVAQLPHLPFPSIWCPFLFTIVEHHGLCPVKWDENQIQLV